MAENARPHSDRRSSDRFPIEREVRYKMLDGKTVLHSGAGKTVDMSSGGVLFTTEHPLNAGNRLELSVNWPAQLDNSCPLKLVALDVEHERAVAGSVKTGNRRIVAGAGLPEHGA